VTPAADGAKLGEVRSEAAGQGIGPSRRDREEALGGSHFEEAAGLCDPAIWLFARRPVYSILGWALHIAIDIFDLEAFDNAPTNQICCSKRFSRI